LKCGGTYEPGETLTTVISDDDDDVLYELNQEVYDGNAYCDGRRTEKKGRTLTAPISNCVRSIIIVLSLLYFCCCFFCRCWLGAERVDGLHHGVVHAQSGGRCRAHKAADKAADETAFAHSDAGADPGSDSAADPAAFEGAVAGSDEVAHAHADALAHALADALTDAAADDALADDGDLQERRAGRRGDGR
jgi:hypothetical protein